MPSSLDHVDCEFAKKPKFPSNGDGEHVNANANAIAIAIAIAGITGQGTGGNSGHFPLLSRY
jgi:hypothetical protein